MSVNDIYIDFEFNDTSERKLNVICVAGMSNGVVFSYDLTNRIKRKCFVDYVNGLEEGTCFVSYAAEAEQRCFLSLGIDIFKFKWIDLHLEYKMLLNKNNDFSYGKQLIQGKEVRTIPPKAYEKQDVGNQKASSGLAAACYKLLGIKIDTQEKDAVRDMIIERTFTDSDMPRIIKYCESDVLYLEQLWKAIQEAILKRVTGSLQFRYLHHAWRRGEYSGLVAEMVTLGYPVSYDEALNFSMRVPEILTILKKDINARTRDELGFDIFDFGDARKTPKKIKSEDGWIDLGIPRKDGNKNVKLIGDYILDKREKGIHPYKTWPLSKETGKPTLSEEEIAKISGARHDYSDSFVDQLLRFARTMQTLNGFLPAKKGKKSFWDSVGTDHFVRPYFNHYGSQSSRSQPSATGFIPLKAAWTRYLIQPPEGYAMYTIDYGSEEYLIAALLSNDAKMIKAYMSGDVYIGFGIAAGILPSNATKKTHGLEREKLKQTVLMVLYGAGSYALASRLALLDTSKHMDDLVGEATEYIDLFEDTYPYYISTKQDILYEYKRKGYLALKDGWIMWGDNDNDKSVQNCPYQGAGAVVMREAHRIARLRHGLQISFTLHDALTGICKVEDLEESLRILAESMEEGFYKVCGDAKGKATIKLDAKAWGYGVEVGKKSVEYRDHLGKMAKMDTNFSTRHIDERAIKEYTTFKPYFSSDLKDLF